MNSTEALTFALVNRFAQEFIPPHLQNDFQAALVQAQQVLAQKPALETWLNQKTAHIDIWQGLLAAPQVTEAVRATVTAAVFAGQWLKIRYWGDKGEKDYEIYPLALVRREGVLYLTLRYAGHADTRLLPLHRILEAQPIDAEPDATEESFDLEDYLASGMPFNVAGEPVLDLHLMFRESIHRTFEGRPLCNTMSISAPVDGWFEVKANGVGNSMALRWWLLGFGDKVRILEPEFLTRELHGLHFDPLTSLMSRRACQEHFRRLDAAAQRIQRPLAVAMVDIDHFKTINDTLGHAAGDRALQEISQRLQTTCRRMDVVGRWGGEEFLILLPETDSTDAAQLAERLRLEVAKTPFSLDDHGTTRQVSISIGITTTQMLNTSSPHAGNRLDLLLRQADKALYLAKQKRNCVRVFS